MGMDPSRTMDDTSGGREYQTTGFQDASMPPSAASRQIDIIDEQWQANHLEAMSCWDFEELLRLCVETFERLNREEENWRHSVLCGGHAYSAEEENAFVALYAKWKDLCENFLAPLAHFEGSGFVIECADQFRACIREAEGLLTPDAQFFDGDALARLRDEAIEDHRRDEVEHVDGPE